MKRFVLLSHERLNYDKVDNVTVSSYEGFYK